MNDSKTIMEVTDIYIRNGVLTADFIQHDPILGKSNGMFNLNIGGSYADAVMEYLKRRLPSAG